MHYLDRSTVPAPECLASYHHPENSWDDVTGQHKEQIRAHLELLQGRRCAYCEGGIDALGQHIEHFRRRYEFKALTFEWTNLYWSCDQKNSCGHYKDRGAGEYDITDLVDPCASDPDVFFRFRADGTITIRAGLTLSDQHRALETLRVFGLNATWGRLRNMRKEAVSGYIRDAEEAISLGFGITELQEYFMEALVAAAAEPFSTVVRHVLTEGP